MKLIFELSGENPTLPFAELECVGTVLDHRAQVAVAECPNPHAAHRLAMSHGVCEYLGECAPDIDSFRRLLSDCAIKTEPTFSGRVRKIHAGNTTLVQQCSQREFEKLIGTMINGPVDLKNPKEEFRAILSEDKCYFGRLLFSIGRGRYDKRNPGKRAFFHPGVMMPRMARALVNISCAQKGDLLLDPFCGTGGTLIEAKILGIEAVGSDCDPLMIDGSRQNVPECDLLVGDATCLPLRDSSVDAVVTDFPYGQSVSIKKENTMEQLYNDALEELHRVLKQRRRAVVVTHQDISGIASRYMDVVQRHEQRVHKSLTRKILVLE
ncbi:MAG: DNA methyltransferase [Methanoregula sp.]|nr:MAG: DNA methyltransferase [Methanoregula sp.]